MGFISKNVNFHMSNSCFWGNGLIRLGIVFILRKYIYVNLSTFLLLYFHVNKSVCFRGEPMTNEQKMQRLQCFDGEMTDVFINLLFMTLPEW